MNSKYRILTLVPAMALSIGLAIPALAQDTSASAPAPASGPRIAAASYSNPQTVGFDTVRSISLRPAARASRIAAANPLSPTSQPVRAENR